jgi:stage IV sporulation protein B
MKTRRIRPTPVRAAVAAALLAAALVSGAAPAMAQTEEELQPTAGETGTWVIPVGQAVGLKLFSNGVLVVGLSQVDTETGPVMPARECGVRTGDVITRINDVTITDIDQVSQLLQTLQGAEMEVQVVRNGKCTALSGEAVQCSTDGKYKFGAWLRDSMAGIGTVTWYDPNSKTFAALGHGITDVDTGALMPIRSGSILPTTVTGVEKGAKGAPGQLHGSFDLTQELGSLTVNSDSGVFGTLSETAWAGDPIPVAKRSQVQVGEAEILANISGNDVEHYQVEIKRIYPQGLSQGRDLLIEVTDPALLSATGGIVQGMSGSPILQNGKLVGAVTHVLVNDPTQGYGILAEEMLDMVS